MSAGYMRNPSKNTETKKADAVFYNPAGTAFMEEGLYVELGNQFLMKDYSHDASDIASFVKNTAQLTLFSFIQMVKLYGTQVILRFSVD